MSATGNTSSIPGILSAVAAQAKTNLVSTFSMAVAWLPSEVENVAEDEVTDFLNTAEVVKGDVGDGKSLSQAWTDAKTTFLGAEASTGRQVLSDAMDELVTLLSAFKL
jgi:hypothetical protein